MIHSTYVLKKFEHLSVVDNVKWRLSVHLLVVYDIQQPTSSSTVNSFSITV
jgi:hypothetical protein